MKNMDIYESLRSVPESAQKKITGGKLNGFTDINPMWRIKMLTETFGVAGFGWYTEVLEKWTDCCGTEMSANMRIALFVKIGEEWSRPIIGIGGSKIAQNFKTGLDFSDEAWKMAYTDAISICCKALGMGANIYFEKDCKDNRTKYDFQADSYSKKTLPYGSNAWKSAVERVGKNEPGIKEKLKNTYLWTAELYEKFDNDVMNYKINNNLL